MRDSSVTMPTWASHVLRAAGIYNLIWGTLIVFCPLLGFDWLGLERPNYPAIVQCLGMVIGVYGIGYWIAARDPAMYWPIILVGLLGKIFGPIGFVYTASVGELPWQMGWTLLTNDLVWWLPFAGILVHGARVHEANRTNADGLTLEQSLKSATIQNGQNLFDLSFQVPLLLVCVRHLGCTFCREALSDLATQRDAIQRGGFVPIVVSMSPDDRIAKMMAYYGLTDVAHISDPDCRLYRTLELPLGTFTQLFGWTTLRRAILEGTAFRFGFGPVVGSVLQLGGNFVVKNGLVVQAIRHANSSQRTDFSTLHCDLTQA